MNRSLAELTALVAQVSDIYAERNDIDRDDDWAILKLQEELGELTAEHLRLSGRGRRKDQDEETILEAREDEAADLLAMLLLYARHNSIDLDKALQRKWFRYLSE
ncbi:nucleoside triphosphate pyrophosphohydrolase family protein [Devosia faecipullorum]|uniref:phosphoribosyl-ATP pyrophosphohydrolase n=1 Tax=Devosia faecipullorum TaxID=2755039 RepID=UPI00187B50D4|nr:phosphoribosyl-ATP pyrophosphohydrolase [Devosia faecipullorum]MBE7732234.1 phosphoribosyl-ATP pyrophosphohydrolase [Devosia faecipullorum]